MATKRRTPKNTGNSQAQAVYSPTIQTVTTTQVFHVTNDRGEHSFHDSKRRLLEYLAKTEFRAVSIVNEEVPLEFAFGR